MSTNKDNNPMLEQTTPAVSPGNYSPVTVYMKDSIGAVFLGIFTTVFLIGWMRTEARYRTLLTQ
ncbi:MAG TPA: hypothetical protein VFR47_21325 [Anaerolineales bacterium]|nr:hypothetical protein [Anaerolineales bacterium]